MDIEVFEEAHWTIHNSILPIGAILIATLLALKAIKTPSLQSPISVVVIAIPTLVAFNNLRNFSPDGYLNDIFGRFLWIWFAHIHFVLSILSQKQGRTPNNVKLKSETRFDNTQHTIFRAPSNRKISGLEAWKLSYKLLFNGRGIGTTWQIRSLDQTVRAGRKSDSISTGNPLFDTLLDPIPSEIEANAQESGDTEKKNGKIASNRSSRRKFICRRLFTLLCRYALMCIYYDFLLFDGLAIYTHFQNSDFAPDKRIYLRRIIPTLQCMISTQKSQACSRSLHHYYSGLTNTSPSLSIITARETWIRLCVALNIILPDWIILSAYHDFFAIIFVGSGLDSPEEWPPLFGDIRQAFTLRGYWTNFWHALIYNSYGSVATRLSQKLVGRGSARSALGRLVSNNIVFVLSGLMHVAVEWQMGSHREGSYGYWWVGGWFLMQIFGFVLEGFVQRLWGYLSGPADRKNTQMWQKCVGYMWVVAWLMWLTPKTLYPVFYVPKLDKHLQ